MGDGSPSNRKIKVLFKWSNVHALSVRFFPCAAASRFVIYFSMRAFSHCSFLRFALLLRICLSFYFILHILRFLFLLFRARSLSLYLSRPAFILRFFCLRLRGAYIASLLSIPFLSLSFLCEIVSGVGLRFSYRNPMFEFTSFCICSLIFMLN